MSRDTIKYIAAFTMLLNHIGYIFMDPPVKDLLMGIGYFTAITMCYFLVEGYQYTRSKKKYADRLLLFGLISQIPYGLAMAKGTLITFIPLNMMFNLFLCFGIIHVFHTVEDHGRRRLYFLALMAGSLVCDWPIVAPVYTLLFLYAGRDKKSQAGAFTKAIIFWGISCLLGWLIPEAGAERIAGISEIFACAGTAEFVPKIFLGLFINVLIPLVGPVASAICILHFYNGKRSEHLRTFSKWFFYLFYPAHLLILGLIRIGFTM